MTRILITGASGFLGWNLTRGLAARHDIYACYLRNPIAEDGGKPVFLDITEPMKVRELFAKLKPQLVVHAAAISQPDLCEKSPEIAGAIIVNGTRHVAIACSEICHASRTLSHAHIRKP